MRAAFWKLHETLLYRHRLMSLNCYVNHEHGRTSGSDHVRRDSEDECS